MQCSDMKVRYGRESARLVSLRDDERDGIDDGISMKVEAGSV